MNAGACRALATITLSLAAVQAQGLADLSFTPDRATFRTDRLEATFSGGTLVALTNRTTGEAYLEAEGAPSLGGLRFGDRRVETAGKATAAAGPEADSAALGASVGGEGRLETTVRADPATGDLLVTQSGTSDAKGIAEVLWGVAGARKDLTVIVPGQGGRALKGQYASGPFDWPIGWEAAMVIVQGQGGGFWVWADDPELSRFKSLDVRRRNGPADLVFGSQNPAPFDDHDRIQSCTWRLAVYEGDWRVPARRYREWMAASWKLQSLTDQQPAWVKDIRFVSITGLDLPLLEALAEAVNPKATLLYVPSWRRDGYDRNYPDYTPVPEFAAFVERAHELGFRVMPHVNYFGCDPRNELYTQFEPYQLTDPYSKEKLWWTWDRADPPIKFAYIDPAHKPWRELFISRMVEAWKQYGFDALHLDQTLCIWNDSRGLMAGLNCAQGNRLLHEELRRALPEVALSGEGLDEVTMAHEAFAQHHALGIDFIGGTWDGSYIRTAHPIRSYLFAPFTQPYGYLGMTNPSNGQLYAAWREAYKHYAVLPTLAFPSANDVARRPGFIRQVLEEAAFFADRDVTPDPEAPWPADAFFPYRTADGRSAAYAADPLGGTVLRVDEGEGQVRTVSRTLHGVEIVDLPGTIPGWRAYDERRLFGLRPEAWYPYFDNPRNMSAFHLEGIPAGLVAATISPGDQLAIVSLERAPTPDGDLLRRLDDATTGVALYDGTEQRQVGPLSLAGGTMAGFTAGGTLFNVHPPWRAGPQGAEALGSAFAEFRLKAPTGPGPIFDSEVFVEQGAVGKTDGVRFTVTARGPADERTESVTTAVSERKRLRLDLAPFAGQEIALRLEVDGGEAHRVDFDWARWASPRVSCEGTETGEVVVVSPWAPQQAIALGGESALAAEPGQPNAFRAAGGFPGTLFLLREPAQTVTLPLDLAQTPFIFSAQTYAGEEATQAQFVSAGPAPVSCGGVSRPALNMHPPNGGVSRADFPLRLPDQPAALTGFIGLRDGSKSAGVRFIVEVNGRPLLSRPVLPPSSWEQVKVDLAPYAGKVIILTLKVDSEGEYAFDWAAWGEVQVENR